MPDTVSGTGDITGSVRHTVLVIHLFPNKTLICSNASPSEAGPTPISPGGPDWPKDNPTSITKDGFRNEPVTQPRPKIHREYFAGDFWKRLSLILWSFQEVTLFSSGQYVEIRGWEPLQPSLGWLEDLEDIHVTTWLEPLDDVTLNPTPPLGYHIYVG